MKSCEQVRNVLSLRPPKNEPTLTGAEVEAYAAEDFIRKALSDPNKVKSVLTFFFGVDYSKKNHIEEMRQGRCLTTMAPFWYEGHKLYDKLCRSFSDVVDAAGRKELHGDDWNKTVDGRMAQILLCQHLARNCFRGDFREYQYDSTGLELAREITEQLVMAEDLPEIPSIGPSIASLKGEFYPPYIAFLVSTLMRSEDLKDHDLAGELLTKGIETSPPHLHSYFEGEEQLQLERRRVLERFGRFPHRNAILNRDTTKPEWSWLSNTKDLPGWARVKYYA